jgi:hypothetical protein
VPLATFVVKTKEFADQDPHGSRSQLWIFQVTPEFVGSLVTTAITGTLAFVSTVVGGA